MATVLEWQGRVGEEWADKADSLDVLLGPVGDVGIEQLGELDGLRVLDLGSGAGATSLMMASKGAVVTGVDISPNMLAKAKERDQNNLCTFILADAATAEYPEPFDALYSRCGAMFFEEPVRAWSHIRTQMKPGGKANIVCWREAVQNEWASLPLTAAASVLGASKTKPSPSGVPGPLAWAEVDVFQKIFSESGWSDVKYSAVDREVIMECGDDPDPVQRAVLFASRVGPLRSRLRGLDENTQMNVGIALTKALQPKLRNGAVRIATAAWVITATA